MKIAQDEIYTTKEVAELLKISLPTVKRMVRDGRLPSIRIGKQHRFLGSDLIEILFVQRGIPRANGEKRVTVQSPEGSPVENTPGSGE